MKVYGKIKDMTIDIVNNKEIVEIQREYDRKNLNPEKSLNTMEVEGIERISFKWDRGSYKLTAKITFLQPVTIFQADKLFLQVQAAMLKTFLEDLSK